MGFEGQEKSKYIKEEFQKRRQNAEDAAKESADLAREERANQRAKENFEREEAQKKRDHELKMATLQAQGNGSTSSVDGDATEPLSRRPFSAPYKEDVPLDVYLRNYDAVCDAFSVADARRLQDLYLLLPQKLLQVLNELDSTIRADYKKVKDALLQATNFSAEDCRERYITAFPRTEESMLNFVKRKERLLDDWLRLSKVPDDQQKLKEFLIWDSIQASLPVDMASHLRVHLKGEVDLKKAAEEADQFLRHSRPGKRLPDILRKPQRNGTNEHQRKPAIPGESQSPSSQRRNHKHQKNGNKSHHHSKQNPLESPNNNKNAVSSTKTEQSAPQQHPHRSSYGGFNKPATTGGNRYQNGGKRYPFNKTSATPPSRSIHGIQIDSKNEDVLEEAPLYDAPSSLSSLTTSGRIKAPLCQGTLNGQDIDIVLDTGAEGIFVDRRLVPECDMTDKTVRIQFAEGKPVERRCCFVQIECPYYEGKAPAMALENPAMPMFLGRVTNLAPYFKVEAYDQAIREWDQRCGDSENTKVVGETSNPRRLRYLWIPLLHLSVGQSVPVQRPGITLFHQYLLMSRWSLCATEKSLRKSKKIVLHSRNGSSMLVVRTL